MRKVIEIKYALKESKTIHTKRVSSEERAREFCHNITTRGYVILRESTVRARKNETAIGEIYESIDY